MENLRHLCVFAFALIILWSKISDFHILFYANLSIEKINKRKGFRPVRIRTLAYPPIIYSRYLSITLSFFFFLSSKTPVLNYTKKKKKKLGYRCKQTTTVFPLASYKGRLFISPLVQSDLPELSLTVKGGIKRVLFWGISSVWPLLQDPTNKLIHYSLIISQFFMSDESSIGFFLEVRC